MDPSVTCQLLYPDRETTGDWLWDSVGIWVPAWPAAKLTAIVSSRIGRQADRKPEWFAALRYDCRTRSLDFHLLAAEGTTTGPFLRRYADLFLQPLVHVRNVVGKPARANHWQLAMQSCAAARDPLTTELWFAPAGEAGVRSTAPWATVPRRDRALIALADEIWVLQLRRGGNWHRLLNGWLDRQPHPERLHVCSGSGLVPQALVEELVCQGATPVELARCPPRGLARSEVPVPHTPCRTSPPPGKFLLHWTRRCDGPWPGQTRQTYEDHLLLGSDESDHSPLASLQRILKQRTLTASRLGIRGGAAVVCFTDHALSELAQRRVFRPHRMRWDFECFGIGIRKRCLQRMGARPVIYGDESRWRSLAAGDRPYFQKISMDVGSVRWSDEREWRVVGDVDLGCLSASDVFVFVPDPTAAARLAQLGDWPVVAVGGNG